MRRPAAPLRFLALVIGAWVIGRAAILAPGWLSGDAGALKASPPASVAAASRPVPVLAVPVRTAAAARAAPVPATVHFAPVPAPDISSATARPELAGPTAIASVMAIIPVPQATATGSTAAPPALAGSEQSAAPSFSPGLPLAARTSPWSASAWALLRQGPGDSLAPGGLLGGSQLGARLTYRLRDRLALSACAYAPVDRPRGAEAAIGIEWQPARTLPVRVLAERRQAIGIEGRSAFALLAHGGVSAAPLLGPLQLDGYAQAGIVGLRSADLFADGSARIGLPIANELIVGVGAWGGVQPGAARLDVGPEASYRLPGTPLRVTAGYRVRIAGDARPGSGPSLTLATDF